MAVSVSLKKLAEILGLAPSTVSRALKGIFLLCAMEYVFCGMECGGVVGLLRKG